MSAGVKLYQAKKLDTLNKELRTTVTRQQDENCRQSSRRDGRSAKSQKPQMVRKVPKKGALD